MHVSIIAAVARNGVIGIGGRLPWNLPADLRQFRRLTWGKPILMGRKTHESIGKALPGRTNIVVSSDPAYRAGNCLVAHSLEEALQMAADAEEAMIVGGAGLYRQALPIAPRLYLTRVHADVAGDTFFPSLTEAEWQEVEREDHEADAENPLPYSFLVLQRHNAPV
jgi:dihydrofolate reductase